MMQHVPSSTEFIFIILALIIIHFIYGIRMAKWLWNTIYSKYYAYFDILEVYYQDIISINESISGNLFIWFFKLLCAQEPRQKWVNAPFDEMNSFYNGNKNRVQPSSN